METADNVTRKYEDCWDGTKQPTIYVWNINKIFCEGFLSLAHTPKHTQKHPKKLLWLVLLNFFNQHLKARRVFVRASVYFDLHICHLSVDRRASTITWIITESRIKGQRCVQVLGGCRLRFGSVANHTYHQQLMVSSSLPVYVPPSYENPSTLCCHDIYDTARSYFIDATQLRTCIKVPFITPANMDLSAPPAVMGRLT